MALTDAFWEAADAEASMSIALPGTIGRLVRETPLKKLTDLYEDGVLTAAEFEAARLRLLTREQAATVPANSTPTASESADSPATKS